MLLVALSSACVNHRDPTSYTASVRKNFVAGCLEGYKPASGKDTEAATHRTLCGCIYDQMTKKTTGISFIEFKSAQAAIRKDPTNPANKIDKLIPKFATYQKNCEAKVNAGP